MPMPTPRPAHVVFRTRLFAVPDLDVIAPGGSAEAQAPVGVDDDPDEWLARLCAISLGVGLALAKVRTGPARWAALTAATVSAVWLWSAIRPRMA